MHISVFFPTDMMGVFYIAPRGFVQRHVCAFRSFATDMSVLCKAPRDFRGFMMLLYRGGLMKPLGKELWKAPKEGDLQSLLLSGFVEPPTAFEAAKQGDLQSAYTKGAFTKHPNKEICNIPK